MIRIGRLLVGVYLGLCIVFQLSASELSLSPRAKKPITITRYSSANLTNTSVPATGIQVTPVFNSFTTNVPVTEIPPKKGTADCPCSDNIEIKININETGPPIDNERIKRTVQEGILRFSLKFQHTLSNTTDKRKTNVLFAPVNILAGLATLLLGSEADAKNEILGLLEFYYRKDLTDKEDAIHEILGGLFANFSSEGEHNPAVKVKMNQGIFYQSGTDLKEDFVKSSKHFYNNELINLNFSSGDDGSVISINEWVANRTEKRITEILKPPLPVDTKLILLNTLFFNGEWEEPFFENSTYSDFFPEKGSPIKVKTMTSSANVYYYYNETYNFSVVGLPYKGGETVMYIILPEKGQKLTSVLSKITSRDLYDIMNSTLKDTEASYSLPYMQLADNVGLRPMLQKLGVRSIFDPIAANLSKIAENIGLYVSEALHNVNLDVTEAGSTGAASTALIIETKFPDKKIINVNRPFSFYIIHRPSGVISFWGTIYDPRLRI